MAGTKISGLTASGAIQASDELMVNDGGVWRKVSVNQIEERILRDDNVGPPTIAANAVTTEKLKYDVDAQPLGFDADMLDGQHAAALALGGGNIPVGGVIMWAGDIADLPTNWQLADGTNGTTDYRDRFLVGAGGAYAVGATGGAKYSNRVHTHGVGTLATQNCSAHRHPMNFLYDRIGGDGTLAWSGTQTADAGIHNHTVLGTTGEAGDATLENRPRYYALAFIERMS